MPTGINIQAITPYSSGIIYVINGILVPVLLAVAFLVFLWGVYKYFILGADSDAERKTGKDFTLWGIIGFVVILSVWGIVNVVMGALGLSAGTMPRIPLFGTGSYTTNGVSGSPTGGTPIFSGAGGSTVGGGSLSPAQSQQNVAQQAYDSCINNGNTAAECTPAYRAYGGTGTPSGNSTVPSVYCPDGSVVADVSECSTSTVYCPDGSVVASAYDCPTTTTFCPDGSQVANVADCPVSSSNTQPQYCTDWNTGDVYPC